MVTLGIDAGSCRLKAVLVSEGRIICYTDESCSGGNLVGMCRQLMDEYPADAVALTGSIARIPSLAGVRAVPLAAALATGGMGASPSCRTVVDLGCADTRIVDVEASIPAGVGRLCDRGGVAVASWLDLAARLLGMTPAELASVGSERHPLPGPPLLAQSEGEVAALLSRGMHRQSVARAVLRGAGQRIGRLLRPRAMRDDLLLAGGWGGSALIREQLQAVLGRRIAAGGHPDLICALGAALMAAGEGEHHAAATH